MASLIKRRWRVLAKNKNSNAMVNEDISKFTDRGLQLSETTTLTSINLKERKFLLVFGDSLTKGHFFYLRYLKREEKLS
ncbi:hypothetical protein RND71_010244 [Anisodus tanguticus]|uniref:Uncharacterized protein n=1 Tax=Anisodus tanguticus TaxID=243964 RepID=A0AAE1SHE0_9SOLA|nr:hypothetical protein RND71_010244 [Anisodus tanguticus]